MNVNSLPLHFYNAIIKQPHQNIESCYNFFWKVINKFKIFQSWFLCFQNLKMLMKYLRDLSWWKSSTNLLKFTTILLWKPLNGQQAEQPGSCCFVSYSVPSLSGLWNIHKVALCNTIFSAFIGSSPCCDYLV